MTLKEYLSSYLGNLETQLGWSATSYDSVISETLLQYGVSSESDATDTTKLYKLGVYFLWHKIYREQTMNIDFSADGANVKLSQQVENIKSQLRMAYADAMPYLPAGRVEVYKSSNFSGLLHSRDEFGRSYYVPYYSR